MKDAWDDDDDWESADLTLPSAPAVAAPAASDDEEETEADRQRARAEADRQLKGAAGGPRQLKAGSIEAKIAAREAAASSLPDVAEISFGPDDDGPRGELDLSVGTREALAAAREPPQPGSGSDSARS